MGLGNADSLLDIDHVHVFVADRTASCTWYARVLGLTPVPELEFWAAEGGPMTLANPARSVSLALFMAGDNAHRATVAFRVAGADFLAWHRDLTAADALDCRASDHTVSYSLYFADPDNNRFEITTYDYADVAPAMAAGEPPE